MSTKIRVEQLIQVLDKQEVNSIKSKLLWQSGIKITVLNCYVFPRI